MKKYDLKTEGIVDKVLADYAVAKMTAKDIIKTTVNYHLIMMIWVSSRMADDAEHNEAKANAIDNLFSQLDIACASSSETLDKMFKLMTTVGELIKEGAKTVSFDDDFKVIDTKKASVSA